MNNSPLSPAVIDLKTPDDSIYKVGIPTPKLLGKDKSKVQRLPAPSLSTLTRVKAKHLTEGAAKTICPITGLSTVTDFPVNPGFYLEAYHPIVHNCRAILRDQAYLSSLNSEQLAGVFLASLHFYRLIQTPLPGLVLNLRLQSTLPHSLLMEVVTFIAKSAATTEKAYPALVLDCPDKVNANQLQSWMNACYEVEHFSYSPTLTVEETINEALEKGVSLKAAQKFTVPSITTSDSSLKKWDAAAFGLWSDLLDTTGISLPAAFVLKAKPFLKKLVSNANGAIISKLLKAIEERVKAEGEGAVEAKAEFLSYVEEKRSEAAILDLYSSDLDLDLPSTPAAPTSIVKEEAPSPSIKQSAGAGMPSEEEGPKVEAPKVEVVEKKPTFAERIAALKAKKEAENA